MHTFCPVVLPTMPLTCEPVTRALSRLATQRHHNCHWLGSTPCPDSHILGMVACYRVRKPSSCAPVQLKHGSSLC